MVLYRMRSICSLLLLLIMFSLLNSLVLAQEAFEVLQITGIILYDPYDNTGIVSLNFTFTPPLSNTTINLTLFHNNIVEIINVTDENGTSLTYSYYAQDRVVSVLVTDMVVEKIIVTYMLENLFEEVSVNLYASIIDLTIYSGLNINVKLVIPGTYNVTIDPQTRYVVENDTTIIELVQPTLYSIALYEVPSEIATTPVITTPTETPPTQTTPTETETTTPTTTSPKETTTPTTKPKPEENYMTILGIIVVLILILAIIVLIIYRKR